MRMCRTGIVAVLQDSDVAGELTGLILHPDAVVRAEIRKLGAGVVDLERAGLGLIPLTGRVRRALGEPAIGAELVPGFYELARPVSAWARSLSETTPVAYVHMEFHGGTGFHAAIGWASGAIVWGPRFTCDHPAEGDEHYNLTAPEDKAINGVLRWLVHRGEAVDEFEAVGFARFRWTNEWAATAT